MMGAEHHFTMLLPGGSFCLRAKALGGGSPGAFPFGRGFLPRRWGSKAQKPQMPQKNSEKAQPATLPLTLLKTPCFDFKAERSQEEVCV